MKLFVTKSTKDKKWVDVEYKPMSFDDGVKIDIDLDKIDQRIFGFGGAFTDASEITYHSLSLDKQKEYIDAYYSKYGLRYNLGRYPLMSTDFSTHSYEYLSDENIDNLSIEHDSKRIDMIKDILSINKDIWIIGALWSPPTFMKSNHDRCHGGRLIDSYYSLYADVLLKSISLLDKRGIHISCLSVQNEPLAIQTWESCLYSSNEEARLLKDYLIPKSKELDLNLSFMIYDHNRDQMLLRADEVFSYLDQKDIFGIAYHWYDRTFFDEVGKAHQKYKDQHLIMTEGCVELLREDNNGLGSWDNGLRYAINMINDLNNGCEGYIDWNLSLNLEGGPNHVGNFCEAPLMIDSTNDEIRYMPSYYIIGHFSRYLSKGDKRVSSSSNDDSMLVTSFIDEDDHLKIIILNNDEIDKNVCISFLDKHVNLKCESKGIYTLIIDLN